MITKKKILLFTLCCTVTHVYARQLFSTLLVAQEYAKNNEEYPVIDNDNWLRPNFSSFYHTQKIGTMRRFLNWLGVWPLSWSIDGFYQLLTDVTKQRELQGYYDDYIQKITPESDDRFIFFGEIFGAFHSLIRDLTSLQQRNIIDDSFVIIDPRYSIVFTGNAIGRSPYSLETLTIILRLMQANPDRVIYVQGTYEYRQRWQEYTLADDLQIRARYFSFDKIPLSNEITNFFNTLPLAAYLVDGKTEEKVRVVRISDNVLESKLNEKYYADFLYEKQDKPGPHLFKLYNEQESEKKIAIEGYIINEDRTTKFERTQGLSALDPHEGIAVWSVFSSPIKAHRQLYDFFSDAYVELVIAKDLKDWTISSYSQDVRQMSGFYQIDKYLFMSVRKVKNTELVGKKSLNNKLVIADKKKEVVFGSTIDLLKGARYQGRLVKTGLLLRFKKAREENNINSRIVILNDEYTPQKTRTMIKQFLNNNIDIILCPLGSPTLESYLDLVREKKVLVLFPNTGAPIARKSDLKYIINWRLSYDYEGEIIAKYTLDELNINKAAIFYQDDVFGHGLLRGAQRVLKERNITNWIEVPYGRNDVNFEKQVNIITQENPSAILFFSSTVAARGLIIQLEIKNLVGKKLLGNSDMAARDFKNFTKQKGITVINPNVVPNPKTSELEIVQEFRKKAQHAYLPLDPFILEAYLAADLIFHIMSKIDGSITKDAIVKTAENFKNYLYKGLTLNFNPQTRELSQTIWMDTGEEEWLEIKQGTLSKN